MGLAVAEFIPADPEWWFRAAEASKLKFGLTTQGIWQESPDCDDAFENFLIGWLTGTPDGWHVLCDWMEARGVHRSVV